MSADKAVVTLLYRCMLRWNKQLASVPLELRAGHIEEVLPGFRKHYGGTVGSIRDLAELGFRQQVTGIDAWTGDSMTKEEHQGLLLDRGFRALKLLNSDYAHALKTLQATRSSHVDAHGIQFPVGTVIKHKKYGYKGIIYAWDKECDRDADWCRQMQVKHDQPFYGVLPDENDCVRLFSGVRSSKYVAEENIEAVQDERVKHRAIMSYFTEYSHQLGRYIPNAKMQYEYPGTYQASDAQSCSSDSNMLLHEETETYNDPYADPYEDNPDSSHGRCPAEEAEVQSQQAAASPSESTPSGDSSKAAGDDKSEADVCAQEGEEGPGDGLPEQNVGTDVKR